MISKLNEAILKLKSPVCVGLDPQLDFIPPRILDPVYGKSGHTLNAAAEALFDFNREIVDHVRDIVPSVKLQSAMYEQFGVPGVEAYARTIDYCHEKGLIVIADVKRGDIGSTSGAYAAAHIGKTKVGDVVMDAFGADFATINPYLGTDGIEPFVKACVEHGRGIFVLVKTSNPSGAEFQDLVFDGKPLYIRVAGKVAEWGSEAMDGDFSEVGAVVGATNPDVALSVREVLPKAMFLVPGYGAQGASGKDLKPFFTEGLSGAIVNSSRGIIAAWEQEKYSSLGKEAVGEAARAATLDMLEDIRASLL